uniref:Uncharacterized protein n=1 Tax=Rhizophora mucronata TaxID=61149 RepID=A0A2P2Q001_RHIMU
MIVENGYFVTLICSFWLYCSPPLFLFLLSNKNRLNCNKKSFIKFFVGS